MKLPLCDLEIDHCGETVSWLKVAVTVFGASMVTVVDALLGDATPLPDQFAKTNPDVVDVTEIGTEVPAL